MDVGGDHTYDTPTTPAAGDGDDGLSARPRDGDPRTLEVESRDSRKDDVILVLDDH